MHQIGNSFTRLEPAIDFSGVALQDDPTTPCVLGDPPARLAAVHSPALANAWHAKLILCLAEPTQTEQRKGHRRVQDLGSAVFDFASDGTVQTYLWKFNENDLPALVSPELRDSLMGKPPLPRKAAQVKVNFERQV